MKIQCLKLQSMVHIMFEISLVLRHVPPTDSSPADVSPTDISPILAKNDDSCL